MGLGMVGIDVCVGVGSLSFTFQGSSSVKYGLMSNMDNLMYNKVSQTMTKYVKVWIKILSEVIRDEALGMS